MFKNIRSTLEEIFWRQKNRRDVKNQHITNIDTYADLVKERTETLKRLSCIEQSMSFVELAKEKEERDKLLFKLWMKDAVVDVIDGYPNHLQFKSPDGVYLFHIVPDKKHIGVNIMSLSREEYQHLEIEFFKRMFAYYFGANGFTIKFESY